MRPSSEWTEEQSETPLDMWVRDTFDPRNDRVGITREWLDALKAMRRARVQLRNGLSKNESAEHIESMQYLY